MTALSSRFAIARSSLAGTPRTTDSSSSVTNVTWGASRCARATASCGDGVELRLGRLELRRPIGGDLDEVGDERAHLLQLADEVAQQRLALDLR